MINQKTPPWMERIRDELGVTEANGLSDNGRILEYFKSLGPYYREIEWKDSDNWCAALINWSLEQVGIPGTNSPAAIDFMRYGRPLKKPRKGCIAVFWRYNPESWESHVGLVNQIYNYDIEILGGNQDNKVCYKWMPEYKLRGYRWPYVTKIMKASLQRGFYRWQLKPSYQLLPKLA